MNDAIKSLTGENWIVGNAAIELCKLFSKLCIFISIIYRNTVMNLTSSWEGVLYIYMFVRYNTVYLW